MVNSNDCLSLTNTGHASTAYNKIGIHLLRNKLKITGSDAQRPVLLKMALNDVLACIVLYCKERRMICRADGSAISDQLLESSTAKILQLENENKRLVKQLALLRDGENASDASKTRKAKSRRIANGVSNASDANGVDVDGLEAENARLALDVRKLKARLVALQTASDNCSALETRASLLDLENKRLVRKVESFHRTADKVESLEQENGRLVSELEQAVAKTKQWSEETAELQLEKERLEQSVRRLEKVVDEGRQRVSRLEEELSEIKKEKDRLQQQLSELAGPADDVALRSDEAPVKLKCEDVNHEAVNASSPAADQSRCVFCDLRTV